MQAQSQGSANFANDTAHVDTVQAFDPRHLFWFQCGERCIFKANCQRRISIPNACWEVTMRSKHLAALLAASIAFGMTSSAHAQGSDPYLGGIWLLGGSFCPRGTAEADGQLLQIAQHEALFSLFGTSYGGDGRTTFALPDLRLADDPKFGTMRYCVNLQGLFPSRN